METKFNFNSQICTSREQSERLLALGLKPETADMVWVEAGYGDDEYLLRPLRPNCFTDIPQIPAWSLHRLLCMLPKTICDGRLSLRITDALSVHYSNKNSLVPVLDYYTICFDIYNTVVFCIEDFIKKGYFNKEYLV